MSENTLGREVFRLLKISREAAPESLLDEALAGRPKNSGFGIKAACVRGQTSRTRRHVSRKARSGFDRDQ